MDIKNDVTKIEIVNCKTKLSLVKTSKHHKIRRNWKLDESEFNS